jgi:hypothetical protein
VKQEACTYCKIVRQKESVVKRDHSFAPTDIKNKKEVYDNSPFFPLKTETLLKEE